MGHSISAAIVRGGNRRRRAREFDTVELGRFRRFDYLFREYPRTLGAPGRPTRVRSRAAATTEREGDAAHRFHEARHRGRGIAAPPHEPEPVVGEPMIGRITMSARRSSRTESGMIDRPNPAATSASTSIWGASCTMCGENRSRDRNRPGNRRRPPARAEKHEGLTAHRAEGDALADPERVIGGQHQDELLVAHVLGSKQGSWRGCG